MSAGTREELYHLLPAIYRIRDAGQGEPLRALLAVIESEVDRLGGDLDRLYDNWFIESCDEWTVAYLGDLLKVRGLRAFEKSPLSQRGLVANTLAYRRAKGTAAVLEQLSRDVTGWPAKAVEFFERLATTQHLNHLRLGKGGTVSLRGAGSLELLGGAFEEAVHTAEVRHIDNGRGRYNIPNVGIFLWRLQSYFVSRSAARPVSDPPDGRYTFNPLGCDAPLFNRPRTETELTQMAAEHNVPDPLRRRPLFDELNNLRSALVEGRPPGSLSFANDPVWQVFVQATNGTPMTELKPEEILVCNLGGWRRPLSETFTRKMGGTFVTQVAVDPVLGRLAFPAGVKPFKVEVSYAYGFSGDVGGGPYNRQDSVANWLKPQERGVDWQIGVMQDQSELLPGSDKSKLVQTLAEAVQRWNDHIALNPDSFGVIAVMDSATYVEDLTATLAERSRLAIVAADWPEDEMGETTQLKRRVAGRLSPDERRPHVRGNISIKGTAPGGNQNAGQLILDGLLVEGALTVEAGNLGTLMLAHCTLVPGLGIGLDGAPLKANQPSVSVEATNILLRVMLDHSITGPLNLPADLGGLNVRDCIIDAPLSKLASGGFSRLLPAIAADVTGKQPGPRATLERCTIFGAVCVRQLDLASEVIFTEPVVAERRQSGCVRFCYLPETSTVPRRFRCQPDVALAELTEKLKPALPWNEEIAAVKSGVRPEFTATRYGAPAYAQLAQASAEEIRAGAEDGSELGAFSFLRQTLRESNLRVSLEEYLRFGLEAGLLYVT